MAKNALWKTVVVRMVALPRSTSSPVLSCTAFCRPPLRPPGWKPGTGTTNEGAWCAIPNALRSRSVGEMCVRSASRGSTPTAVAPCEANRSTRAPGVISRRSEMATMASKRAPIARSVRVGNSEEMLAADGASAELPSSTP